MSPDNYYKSQLNWLFSQFPNYQKQGNSAYKPGLQNTNKLLSIFGDPHKHLKHIHVAGTNGKGSVCAYMASMLTEKKERVGLFTSPHLWDFRERIRINGKKISKKFIIDFCKKIQSTALDFNPSFFEITFVMAMSYFMELNCSICVIETGMGGRLDATNTITPILSIITNIGIDHVEFLGTNLETIAEEKAGIIKQNTPILIGQKQEKIEHVFSNKAIQHKSQLYLSSDSNIQHEKLDIDYKKKNFDTALSGMNIINIIYNDRVVQNALDNLEKNTGLQGRFQKIQSDPEVYIDVAHNLDGIINVLSRFSKDKDLHIIYGSSKEKNYKEIIRFLTQKHTVALSQFKNERSLTKEDLDLLHKEFPNISNTYVDVNLALREILNNSVGNTKILICGSFFLIADLKIEEAN